MFIRSRAWVYGRLLGLQLTLIKVQIIWPIPITASPELIECSPPKQAFPGFYGASNEQA
jgi:hypothetical protein